MSESKPLKQIHTILLDASPILLNQPSISTLLANAEQLVTTAAVVGELRGEEARQRFETLYQPFIQVRAPKPDSVTFVRDFAKRTGDLAVLSATDIEVLALAYDLECERNGGDWRLRRAPGQKRVNGAKPEPKSTEETSTQNVDEVTAAVAQTSLHDSPATVNETAPATDGSITESKTESVTQDNTVAPTSSSVEGQLEEPIEEPIEEYVESSDQVPEDQSGDSDDGWITPSNIKKKQAKDESGANTSQNETKTLQVATMTGDFAMQNVLLQMNLNLLSTKTCKRIAHIKRTIFRCHACFATTKDMSKQFCPRCGGPTLTRVSCTTNDKGEVKLHLKQNFQWNNKGNVYSIPKPTTSSANQKWKGTKSGGGQGGWGSDLILAEDQKEYIRAMANQKRTKQKDLMDEDTLPGFFTGDRAPSGGRVRVGAGRTVNSRKR